MTKWLVVTHKVEDYNTFKKVFDESEEIRREYGLKGGCISRDIENPNLYAVVLEADDLNRAREFMNSDYIKDAMKRAGVSGPHITYLEDVAEVPEPMPAATGEDLDYNV